ncbi:MAG: hypothetical protein OXG79_11300 [Chloroflexi bacterium]|nr:hypothetical protein [Chloroflexota bacterium]
MTTEHLGGRYFADALDGRVDITDSYEVLGDLPNLVGVSSGEEDEIVDQIRRLIQDEGGGVATIGGTAAPATADANNLYHADLIAAVDGTDAVAPLRFVADTLYAVGMVRVTPRTHHQPKAFVTRTRASHSASQSLPSGNLSDAVQRWSEHLRGAREHERSWTSTFREYGEREVALDWLRGDDARFVLVDGPIITQNMLTQDRARGLLQNLVATRRAIGFIKELTANPLLTAIGYALRPDEVFVLSDWRNILSDRFGARQRHIGTWVEQHGEAIVRAVYKVRNRAFAVECHIERLPLAFAILEHDNGGALDHDIPMLLQIADNHVRSRFNGNRAREEVIARFASSEPSRFLALTSERGLR